MWYEIGKKAGDGKSKNESHNSKDGCERQAAQIEADAEAQFERGRINTDEYKEYMKKAAAIRAGKSEGYNYGGIVGSSGGKSCTDFTGE